MKKPVKILHIDLNWKIFHLVVLPGTLIKTPISLETTLDMVKENNFDLIISEPHHKAILTPHTLASAKLVSTV
jgi:hypothetical protein